MVAVQMLLMHSFLLGHLSNDVLPPEEWMLCSLGCSNCSPVNGCLACKPPFLLALRREGFRQTGICVRDCPNGFYGHYRGKIGFCIKCQIRGCQNCLSRHFCLECHKGKVPFKGRCKRKCPIDYPYNPHRKACKKNYTVESAANSTRVSFALDHLEGLEKAVYSSSSKKCLTKEERRKRKERTRRRRRKLKKKRRRRLKKERRKKEQKRPRKRHKKRRRKRKKKNSRRKNGSNLVQSNNSTRSR